MNTVRRGLLLVPLTVTAPSTVGYQPRLSVSTLTSYGWTAESARTGVISC
jgi:hypothetical protein